MKNILKFTLAAMSLGALVLMSCFIAGCSCQKKPVLHIYIWADYISPEVVHKFELLYGCRVQQDLFDSNEMMFAKMQAGGDGYDIVCPSHYFIHKMAGAGLIQKLDYTQLPNVLAHVDQSVASKLDDLTISYSVPYFMSYTGLGYDTKAVEDFKPTWDIYLDSKYMNRMTMLDDYIEVIGAGARYHGWTIYEILEDSAKLDEVVKTCIAWKKNVIKFDNEQYKNGLATNEFLVVMGYFSDLAQIVDENDNLALALPEEGFMMSCDMLAVPSTSKNPALAHAFINFIYGPENSAQNMVDVYAAMPSQDACKLLPEEFKEDEAIFPSSEALAKAEMVPELDAAQEKILIDAWQKIKAAD